MNILYLAHRIPFPANKGDKLRALNQIKHLSKRHRIWCACFVDTPSDQQFAGPLSTYCERLAAIPLNRTAATIRGLAGLLGGGTVTESFYNNAAMKSVVRNWASLVRFDAVVAFSSSMARYAFEVPARRRVLDMCDLDSKKWLDYADASGRFVRWLYGIEGKRLAARERAWLRTFDASILITEAEAQPVRGLAPPGRLHIVGNGVALPPTNGTPKPCGEVARGCTASREIERDAESPVMTVGFIGAMNYRPNVDAVRWFVANCWPAIRAACPKAVFRIVGRSPARPVRRLEGIRGVQVVGEVDDAESEIGRFDVSVAPMRIARGLQNKVLEAMAATKPVVLSSKAAQGINAIQGRDYLVADTAEEVIDGVLRLLVDPAERARLGANARRFVAANHCWEGELQKFELIVLGVIGRTAPAERVLRAYPETSVEPASQPVRA